MMARKSGCSSSASAAAGPPPLPASTAEAGAPLPELPEEVILEILLRLPVKPLFRFRCVSKSWDALFYDPCFLKEYNSKSKSKSDDDKKKILMIGRGYKYLKSLPVSILLRDKSWVGSQNLRLPLRKRRAEIIGCCNGLVCFFVRKSTLIIYFWNPSINQTLRLPYTFFPGFGKYGFGFDDSINDFKLVRVFKVENDPGSLLITEEYEKAPYSVEVYGMWEGSRRRISDFPHGRRPCNLSEPICLHGAMHWIAADTSNSHNNDNNRRRKVIVVLDLAKETFQQQVLPLPYAYAHYQQQQQQQQQVFDDRDEGLNESARWCLYLVGELLSVTFTHFGSHADVWIMKEYGVEDSWTKLVTIPFVDLNSPRGSKYFEHWELISCPIYYSEAKGELFMLFHGKPV